MDWPVTQANLYGRVGDYTSLNGMRYLGQGRFSGSIIASGSFAEIYAETLIRHINESFPSGTHCFIGFLLRIRAGASTSLVFVSNKVESLNFSEEAAHRLKCTEHFRSWPQKEVAKSVQCGEPIFPMQQGCQLQRPFLFADS